ncbi:MAG: hypothetical protein U7126_16750 [Microcoleus sp.]
MKENRNSGESDKQVPNYYDQIDTDNFYQKVSGGEHVHIGLFKHPNEDLESAKKRTTEYMASLLNIDDNCRILDLGAGIWRCSQIPSQNLFLSSLLLKY